eukprot:9515748-Alexandrium_andersonii.AAC.1
MACSLSLLAACISLRAGLFGRCRERPLACVRVRARILFAVLRLWTVYEQCSPCCALVEGTVCFFPALSSAFLLIESA